MENTEFEKAFDEESDATEPQAGTTETRRGPLPKTQFCKHSLVPLYCAHCKYGDSLSDIFRNCA